MNLPDKHCNKCMYKKRCGSCSLCEALICNKSCDSCYVICYKKSGIKEYINSFDSLDIKIDKNNYVELPFSIPVIQNSISNFIKDKNLGFIAVNGSSILSSNGEKIRNKFKDKTITNSMNLKNGTKTILEFYIKDRFLEGLWDNRFSIYKDLKKMEFNYIISPNFSVYQDLPRLDHMYNIKRSSIAYNELLQNNINAIPDIGWYNVKDLECWINEINKNDIRIISYSFQNVGVGLKPSDSWRQNLLGLRYLCSNIKNDVDILIIGVASPFRILEIYKSINKKNRLIILNQTAFIHSRKAMLSETREKNYDMSFDDIFYKNICYYNHIYSQIYKEDKLLSIAKLNKDQLIEFHKDYSKRSDSKESDYIFGFLRRCLKKKHVKEETLFQNQEEIT